jgi:hypothetical protein
MDRFLIKLYKDPKSKEARLADKRFQSFVHKTPTDEVWHLFENGRKPVLRPARYSGKRILKLPLPKGLHRNQAAQEWITRETEKVLNHVSDSYDNERKQHYDGFPKAAKA